MQEFINSLKVDFSKAQELENGFQKFSDLLKSLTDERLEEYNHWVNNSLDGIDEDSTKDNISKVAFLYSNFISIFEEPGTEKIRMDSDGGWIQHMQILIASEGMRRKDIFSDVEGSLIGETLDIKPGINFNKAIDSFKHSGYSFKKSKNG